MSVRTGSARIAVAGPASLSAAAGRACHCAAARSARSASTSAATLRCVENRNRAAVSNSAMPTSPGRPVRLIVQAHVAWRAPGLFSF